jgi:nitrate/nitrite transporter NarK
MVPWLGAAVGATTGGFISDRLTEFLGPRRGYRLVPVVALPLVAVMLIALIYSPSAHGSVACLSVVFFAIEINEGAYWAATMGIAKEDTSAATGVLNTGATSGG